MACPIEQKSWLTKEQEEEDKWEGEDDKPMEKNNLICSHLCISELHGVNTRWYGNGGMAQTW